MFKCLAAIALALISSFCSAIAVAGAGTPDAANLSQQISDFLTAQASAYPGTVQITVDPPRIDKLSECLQNEIFLPSGTRLRPRLTVGIRCLTPSTWVSYTQASLSITGSYYVSAHSLKPGTTLTMSDVHAREGDLLRLAPNVILDPAQLIGSVTTQRIGAGSPIKANALRSSDSIQRGQAVRLEARGVGFIASSDGKAMQSGEPGHQIQVRTASGQIVSATVLNANTVLVIL